jgi:alkylation response protein AidB-like acyl-CoA dehydrogenase
VSEILKRVELTAATVRADAEESERGRQLTPAVVDALRSAGVFRMAMSTSLGGPGLSPLEQLDVLEALASFDGATGWCGMINCDGGYATAHLARDVAVELYPSLDAPTVLVANPSGQARAEGDGFVVSGQWAFASGSSHAELFFLHSIVFDGDALRIDESTGMPVTRMVGLRREDVELLDTWHTTGLAATASNDVRVDGAFVPASRTFDLFNPQPVDPAPLYQFVWFFITKMAAVPLGVAQAAIDDAIEVASTKVTMPTFALAREDAVVQDNLGRAAALVRSARAYAYDSIGRTWDTVCAGSVPTPIEWADTRLAITNAFTASKQAVGLIYESLGTTGVYRRSPLDRRMRDIVTMGQHVVAQTKTYGAAGRRLLGLEPGLVGF